MATSKWPMLHDVDHFLGHMFDRSKFAAGDMAVDLYHEGGKLIAEMSIPGMDAKNIDVSVEGDVLKIKGHREEKKEIKDKEYYSKEIRRGNFERRIKLPGHVDAKTMEASYKDGVLKVTMVQEAGAESHRVEVKAS
jgi:HSP20 family protein